MSNYTKSTNFATKDNLPTGDPLKIVKGTEIDTEYNNIATAIATKTDNASAAITGGTIAGVTVTSSNATITGGSITGITDLAIADGGTGASTATAALNNLLPSQGGNANKYLQTNATNASWDSINLSTGDITGTLAVGNGGTGITSFGTGVGIFLGTPTSFNLLSTVTDPTGSGALVFANTPTMVSPILGTPTSVTLTNATGLPLSTGITGLGTGVATALAINTPNIGAMVVNGGALGTPSSGVVTNLTGTASININGQVGSSTPNSGNFTTLSASSTVNISGGTVDGVAYLDASKVLTTGSVLSFSGVHLTSNRTKDTTYSGTDYTTYPNGFILQNSATPATGLFNSIYFKNNANMQNVFGVVQNSSGYGDFVWAGFAGTHTEWMRLSSAGLTLTSNPTLSGGTANGVTYLNGSKVLTSGSALTFDGTNLGVGGTSGGAKLHVITSNPSISTVESSNGTGGYQTFSNGSTVPLYVGFGGTLVTGLSTSDAAFRYSNNLVFGYGATEVMRLTSTSLYTASGINVGFGLSNPTVKLDVSAGSGTGIRLKSTGAYGNFIADNTGTTGGGSYAAYQNGAQITIFGVEGAILGNTSTNTAIFNDVVGGGIKLYTNASATPKATLDSAGNLGLGVTPSAWTLGKAIELGTVGNAIWGVSATQLSITQNAYFDGSWKYAANGYATRFQEDSGAYIWNTSPNNTSGAGAGITFTAAMTLDASGNLGIGNTTPSSFDAQADNLVVGSGTGHNGMTVYAGTAFWSSIYFADGTTGSSAYRGILGYDHAVDSMFFYTGATERARIDSSGNLLVGTTSSSSTSGTGLKITAGSSQADSLSIVTGATTDAGLTTYQLYSTGASAYRFYVGAGGTVFATSIVISAISDQRLKENVRDIETGLNAIMALKPRRFDWKDGKGQDKKNVAGFIAQEFENVFPECVGTSKAGEDGIEYKNINHETLIPTLVKAMQELKTEFDAYKASHP